MYIENEINIPVMILRLGVCSINFYNVIY